MLNGETPLNLKDAVFFVENSFFEGHLDRKRYEERISEMVTIAKAKAIQDRYNWNNPVARNMMLYRVMSDTLNVSYPDRKSLRFHSLCNTTLKTSAEQRIGEKILMCF